MEDILPYLGVEPDYSEVDMSRVTVRMPNLAGKTESEAAAILEEDHLNYKIIGDGDKIVSQIPAHGRELPGNSTVLLYTDDSMPTDEVEVPNLTGMTVAQASTTLSQLGLYLQAKGTDSNAWYVVVTKAGHRRRNKGPARHDDRRHIHGYDRTGLKKVECNEITRAFAGHRGARTERRPGAGADGREL